MRACDSGFVTMRALAACDGRVRAASMSKKTKSSEKPKAPAQQPKKEMLHYQNYAVGFFELMGQSRDLLRFGTLKETDPALIEKVVLHPAVSCIRQLRNVFERNFKEAEKPSVLLRHVHGRFGYVHVLERARLR
jgi:hypothetical protein